MKPINYLLALAIFLPTAGCLLEAQTVSGPSLNGVVTDPSGALVPGAQQGGHRAALASHPATPRFHHQAAQSRVQWIARHLPRCAARGAELPQQLLRLNDGGGGWSVEPI